MNAFDVILLVLVGLALFFALRRTVRSFRSGKCPGCGPDCDCSGCGCGTPGCTGKKKT